MLHRMAIRPDLARICGPGAIRRANRWRALSREEESDQLTHSALVVLATEVMDPATDPYYAGLTPGPCFEAVIPCPLHIRVGLVYVYGYGWARGAEPWVLRWGVYRGDVLGTGDQLVESIGPSGGPLHVDASVDGMGALSRLIVCMGDLHVRLQGVACRALLTGARKARETFDEWATADEAARRRSLT